LSHVTIICSIRNKLQNKTRTNLQSSPLLTHPPFHFPEDSNFPTFYSCAGQASLQIWT